MKAQQLACSVYAATARIPKSEVFGISNQMRRAPVSIASNIAEGAGRDTPADLCRFLQIAMGSASELHSQLLLSCDLGFLSSDQLAPMEQHVVEVKRMLSALIVKIRRPRSAAAPSSVHPSQNCAL